MSSYEREDTSEFDVSGFSLRGWEKTPGAADGQPQKRATLILLSSGGETRTFSIGERAMVGRDPDCEISIASVDISRRHAELRCGIDGKFLIEDLDSRNGTRINGRPVKVAPLEFGDKITIGTNAMLLFLRYDKLEDQLLQHQRLESIGRLAGSVAHDFQNLLYIILANLTYVREAPPGSTLTQPDIHGALEDAEAGVRRAMELTSNLLSFARSDAPLGRVAVDVTALIHEVARLVQRTFDPRIRIVVNAEPVLVVSGDPGQLHQVLMNLAINARDAMPDGGVLTITARREPLSGAEAVVRYPVGTEGILRVVVEDTGCGMNEETRQRIFEPFFTTKERGRGTGLGLSTVYTAVKNHGGDVSAESEIGKGSRFTVWLPIIKDISPPMPAASMPPFRR